ncbi:MAG: 3-deoxy-manno-octulosonate cytidylyltransferase [Firmicutes bacterium]|nr:3-deoxy-manno-octulosonate cytidylyltransferase [Bacillota bacterium]
MRVLGIIPARYGSTRLAGKPLAEICGRPMIEHVYRRAAAARCLDLLLVATDDERIAAAVEAFGGRAVMTDPHHRSGTDRCAEVARAHPAFDVVVNIQGDEPLLDPHLIEETVAALAEDPAVLMSTPARRREGEADEDPNVVKVVVNLKGDALYFSRRPIPYPRRVEEGLVAYEHIGLYCYRREFLLHLATLPPTPLEKIESLEQLRVLEHGYPIRVVVTSSSSPTLAVDTPEDLKRVRAIMAGLEHQDSFVDRGRLNPSG